MNEENFFVSGGCLVWSGYCPSDDKCKYGYYIPGNMFIVAVLTKLAPLFEEVLQDTERAKICTRWAGEIQAELERLSAVEKNGKRVYALETDGQEIRTCVDMLINSTGGTGYIHESVDKDDDKIYSGPWFAWANSLFAYMIIEKKSYL